MDDDAVFRALADPTRRHLMDALHERDGRTLSELVDGLAMSRQAVSKHLAVLAEASLVTAVRRGRERRHHLNPAPLAEVGDRWIRRYHRGRVDALTDLKRALEDPVTDTTDAVTTHPDATAFVYVSYIRTSPEKLWEALTTPAFVRRYFGGGGPDSDWQVGSSVRWSMGGEPAQRLGASTSSRPTRPAGSPTPGTTTSPRCRRCSAGRTRSSRSCGRSRSRG